MYGYLGTFRTSLSMIKYSQAVFEYLRVLLSCKALDRYLENRN